MHSNQTLLSHNFLAAFPPFPPPASAQIRCTYKHIWVLFRLRWTLTFPVLLLPFRRSPVTVFLSRVNPPLAAFRISAIFPKLLGILCVCVTSSVSLKWNMPEILSTSIFPIPFLSRAPSMVATLSLTIRQVWGWYALSLYRKSREAYAA